MEYSLPTQCISVAALLTNESGEVLLLRTHRRSDTWEMPGGNVERGEPLDKAIKREFLEETGIIIEPIGITGVYMNITKQVLTICFRAQYVSGEINVQEDEIVEAKYIKIDESNIYEYITKPQQRSRLLDAMHAKSFVPFEAWEADPSYKLINRLD
ncbi:NUDIX hydrolase [Paenibacillus sacheonensis]|uniref:NUDIX domain-containing protein n=1 Tax=Paenibacillus sacheonensis TaxID=742054 RepID=A0A7X4YK43_9BACL|nr:NUDIX domain-containing protein [Paenibacillus sacheonensis]MBM7563885.1 8-oxo-dGTP diphosphatase [Paenibacillus sacheonensis]NBC67768.1 NUDIX domain-containing protein [Paenibacillus sacheonensis]